MKLKRTATLAVPLFVIVVIGAVAAPPAGGRASSSITVQGEAATRTNIPVKPDRRASGRAYLALDTRRTPPRQGWYAIYNVKAPAAGVYRLRAVATVPLERDEDAEVGSYVNLSVNGASYIQVARSQPLWARSPRVWGDLYRAEYAEVELRRGVNTIRFMVNEPAVVGESVRHRLLLDTFTLTPVKTALRDAYIQDPLANLGVYRGGERAVLHVRRNGHAPVAWAVRYEITDYFSAKVATGTATIPAGATTASVRLPALPPGHFTVQASAAGSTVVGTFAHLPERRPSGDRFGVNTFVSSLVPSSRLGALADALREMGAGYVRDGGSWPAAQPRRGAYVATPQERVLRTFRQHGLKTLEVLSAPPEWALTPSSVPLPSDLRVAYDYAAHMARHVRPDAVQLSNEPDVDETASTGDQHAAYVKAAALGLADTPGRPLIVLPGIAGAGPFQRLMLQNDMVRYGDAWAFHGYADERDPAVPGAADEQRGLWRSYGAGRAMWMTESGILMQTPTGLTRAQQTVQARYLVRAAVQDLASGVDKHFWFVGPPTRDGGVDFGMLTDTFQPRPAYSAHAAMTSLLGEANYRGKPRGLPSGVVGHEFSSGDKTITVLWAAKPTQLTVPAQTTYNVMGARTQAAPADKGTTRITVSPDPIYAVTPTTKQPQMAPTQRPAKPSAAEHIVLNQRYAAKNQAPGKDNGDAPPPHGYRLATKTRMSVDIYNFTNSPQTIVLSAHAPKAWSVRPLTRTPIRIPAKGRLSIPFEIQASPNAKPGHDYQLTFKATLNGHPIPRSTAWIQLVSRPVP